MAKLIKPIGKRLMAQNNSKLKKAKTREKKRGLWTTNDELWIADRKKPKHSSKREKTTEKSRKLIVKKCFDLSAPKKSRNIVKKRPVFRRR